MQEVNELKNLVIQSLEANGILGQIRAQIRSSVFKIIEMQDANQKKKSGFFWENPQCQKIYDYKEGQLALEVMNDFMNFFKMDYTSSIFTQETNFKESSRQNNLREMLGLDNYDKEQPVLFNILQALQNGDLQISDRKQQNTQQQQKQEKTTQDENKPSRSNIVTNLMDADFEKSQEDQFSKKKGFPSIEPLNKKQQDLQTGGFEGLGSNPKKGKLAPIGQSLSPQEVPKNNFFDGYEDYDDEDLEGSQEKKNLAEAEQKLKQIGNNFNKIGELSSADKKSDNVESKQQEEDSDHEYDDEVFENVEEDLVDENDYEDDPKQNKNIMFASSEDPIGASQSQGFDASVDSLVLEEYDHYEDAAK